MSARSNVSISAKRSLMIAVYLAGCSGNPSAAHPETPESASAPAQGGSAEGPAAPPEPLGGSLKGPAIEAWFRQRGAATPGTLNLEDAQCEAVRAPVSSGQALSCEQHAAIKPWVRMSRRILFDAHDGRASVLLNLTSKVESFEPSNSSGDGCGGALLALHVQVSADGKAVTVADDASCGCEQAEKLLDKGNTGDAKAAELQTREVKQACSQRGAYMWTDHGYAPAQGE